MKVTVIIPTYNREMLVCEAIESILSQDMENVEVLVVDDGSTDGTWQRLQRYGDRIRCIRQENRGVNAARNVAVERSHGEYLAFLDSDDLWLPAKLKLQVAILERIPEAGFLFSDFYILKPDGSRRPEGLSTWHSNPRRLQELYDRSFLASELLDSTAAENPFGECRVYVGDIYVPSLYSPYVLPSTSLVRRSCFGGDLRFNGNDSTCGDDWEFFARASRRYGAAYLDVETTLNRSHEDAVRLTRISRTIRAERRVRMIERVWRSDREYYSQSRHEVDHVLSQSLLELAKLQLLDGDSKGARSSINRLRQLSTHGFGFKETALGAAAFFPGATHVLRFLRRLLQTRGGFPLHKSRVPDEGESPGVI